MYYAERWRKTKGGNKEEEVEEKEELWSDKDRWWDLVARQPYT
jgi:hypothetical protein